MQEQAVLSLHEVARLLGTSFLDVRTRARDFDYSILDEDFNRDSQRAEWVN